jgi:hypothetical protein
MWTPALKSTRLPPAASPGRAILRPGSTNQRPRERLTGHRPRLLLRATGRGKQQPVAHRSVGDKAEQTVESIHEHRSALINPGVRRNGRLTTAGALPSDASAYNKILITLETRPNRNPTVPGRIVLTGTGTLR